MSGVQMALPDGAAGPCVGKTCLAIKVETVTLPDGTLVRHERPLSPMELSVLAGDTSSAMLQSRSAQSASRDWLLLKKWRGLPACDDGSGSSPRAMKPPPSE